MLARDVMKSPVITVYDDQTLADVTRLLDEHKVSGLPVLNRQGELVGIVSEHDLIRRSQELQVRMAQSAMGWLSPYSSVEDIASYTQGLCTVGATLVRDAMTKKVLTVNVDDSLESVAKTMAKRRINRLPVLEDGQLVGIISRGELIWAMGNLCERKPGILSQ